MNKTDVPVDYPIPTWVPEPARHYIEHIEHGDPIRAIARDAGCHASTILRQVRKVEGLRDDLLIDSALKRLGERFQNPRQNSDDPSRKETSVMTIHMPAEVTSGSNLDTEIVRALARIGEASACLAVAKDMEKAVIVRETADGRTVRTAVIDREIAEALALNGWIVCTREGRIARYGITPAGRAHLKKQAALLETATGAEHLSDLDDQDVTDVAETRPLSRADKVRYNLAESPLAVLARRQDPAGNPFLSAEMVAAGERFREDFELAQTRDGAAPDWASYLTAGGGAGADTGFRARSMSAAQAAEARIGAALSELGPGLGDVALRCLCFLEGLEDTERRMGWSARSGKIVLRIALDRLCRHYDESSGNWSPMIG